jgi:hypothetical protein
MSLQEDEKLSKNHHFSFVTLNKDVTTFGMTRKAEDF